MEGWRVFNYMNKILLFFVVVIVLGVLGGISYWWWSQENMSTVSSSVDSFGPPSREVFKVSGVAAVFFQPNSAWIETMKKENEDAFYVIADDAMYSYSIATDFLNKENIKILSTDKRYLQFIKDNGEDVVIDRNSISREGWGVFLFDGKRDPFNANMAVIQTDYESYFRR